jgi:hypothetical protein
MKQMDGRRLKGEEIKFMGRTAGYSLLDHRNNEDILEELKVGPVGKKLAQCKQKWLNHVSRMEDLTSLLTAWFRILFEKLIVTQLVKKIMLSYGTRRFITMFTQVRHWTLS